MKEGEQLKKIRRVPLVWNQTRKTQEIRHLEMDTLSLIGKIIL